MKTEGNDFSSKEKSKTNEPLPDFSKMDFYQRLGLIRTATKEEIKKAFRAATLKYHPDKNLSKKEYTIAYQYLTEAYETLSDESKRSLYNLRTIDHSNYTGNKSNRDDFFRDFAKGRSGSGDFGQRTQQTSYTRQETSPPPPPDIKTVTKGAVEQVAKGAFWYKKYIEEMVARGCKEASGLLKNPEIQNTITSFAMSEAIRGGFWYGKYVAEWTEQGFDRSILDKNPKILGIIKDMAIEQALRGGFWYGKYITEWQEGGINLQNLIQTPEIHSVIKKEALVQAKRGAFWFGKFIEEWEENGGFNRMVFLSDSDLQRIIKEGADTESKRGDFYYDSFVQEWQKVGISVKK